jgi:hypothetical protein
LRTAFFRAHRHNSAACNVYSPSIAFSSETGESPERSVLRLLSLLLALPLALLAAVPAAAAQSVPSGYTVRGTVVNAITGQPIARALVSMGQDQAMLTAGNGQFSFDNVVAGGNSLSVSKPGYQGHGGTMGSMMVSSRSGSMHVQTGPPIPIQIGPNTPAFTVRLTPLAMITGHITLSTADPADNIRLQVFMRHYENGHPQWASVGRTRTRSDGSFRISSLEVGSYIVSTMASLDRPGQSLNGHGPIWGYPSLYYPGVTDPGAAGVLHLGAGQQAEADITLTRQQFFPVTALVHSSGDSPPGEFQILDDGGRLTGLSATFDRREGIVRAAVPNGTWTMQAHSFGPTMEWGSTTFQVNGAPTSFAINLQTVPHIPIVVRREFQASADGSQPELVPSGPSLNITLTSADEMGAGGTGGMAPAPGSNGADWELQVSQPGRYWIKTQAFPPAYISSITSGGTDLGSNPLVIVQGSTPPSVEVTLRNDGGTITGQIAGLSSNPRSNPASGQRPQLWIYAIPLFSTPASVPEASLQADNQFTIPNLAPGSYRVVACDAPQEIDFHSPEGLAAWAGKGQTVTVDPGGTASVNLDIVYVNAGETP